MTSVQLAAETAADAQGTSAGDGSGRGSAVLGGDRSPAGVCESREILGMRVDATSYDEVAEAIAALATAGRGGAVCIATVHMVMEAFDDPSFRSIVNAADRVTPDGVPLVWALRALGVANAMRVYGPSLVPVVCELAAQRGIPVGFHGGSTTVNDRMASRLHRDFPALRIAYAHAPPFRELSAEEDDVITAGILASGARILFVGLGCPRQERWIAAHRSRLPCAMVGVGAAFDFIAGAKPQAPAWLQGAGLEWLFRLVSEPRRLWHRYLYHNPRFVRHFLRQLREQRT